MTDDDASDSPSLPAGPFSAWLAGMERALRGEAASDVPCDGCTACCTSSQFVHIAPDEVATLARIPAALRFRAPRLPAGHVVLGYDERGHCPLLVDGACSIYDDRPRTCRTYDCRVFPASGVVLDDADKAAIAERARRWRFEFPDVVDRKEHAAVVAAARFVREHADLLPADVAPVTATQRAVVAIQVHRAFLHLDDATEREPEPALAPERAAKVVEILETQR